MNMITDLIGILLNETMKNGSLYDERRHIHIHNNNTNFTQMDVLDLCRNSTTKHADCDGVPMYLSIAYVCMAFGIMFFFCALAYFYLTSW
jgi:hypothetical protein